ncbi:MATE family efflux transporter [Bacillus pseudomycoides]|uniref:MATE family efflux transporter n=1 Tax=Bacillus pseudomycoides TaxID=64104 RepID=UPI000BF0B1A2|nr:MATE family efflux transporter [Bacillus pseudomycoides]PEI92434.1 MATE family efflux transporter [Bacillus pseudomycoides]PEM64955.1 MATE family efflux transporter [Bacillus pseudomycoides]PGA59765.1 MATE family efflux transporter [Bacillus pseudomycoides]PHA48011.1 MATE family efflux transporter [Bacillus pseudomycoides]PHA63098.1 MATE family efflux transporter [Bacillus pseudomycoides]
MTEITSKKGQGEKLNLFFLTWPIFLEVFLFMLMGIADTFMLSALSDDAVSGVGAANQYLHIAILVLEVIGNGAAIVVSQYLGSKRYMEASKISALAVTLNLGVGLIISAGFLLFSKNMMMAMNLQGDVLTYAQNYLSIVGGAIFLQAIINSLAAIIRVHGFTKQAMLISLGMNIFHIAGNYVLIFGKFGFPEMGVQGAAISSSFSRLIALIVFFWLLYRVMEYRVKLNYYITLSKEYIGKILKIGIPAAFEQVMYQACQIVFLYYATYLGAESLAARQYATNISMFTYLFAIAIGMGTAIIVGRLVGGNEKDEAYVRVWKSVKWAIGVTLCMVILVITFRTQLMGLFTDNPHVIALGATVLLLSIMLETGRTMNIVIINSLRAAGDAKYPVLIGAFSMVLMSLPLGYFFVFYLHMGLPGIWLAIAIDEWTRAIIMFFRWKSRAWENYALVKPETAEESAPVQA